VSLLREYSLFQLWDFTQYFKVVLYLYTDVDTKQCLISGKLSINKLNPWETAAWMDTPYFHVSSQGGEIMARNTNVTGTEITSFPVIL